MGSVIELLFIFQSEEDYLMTDTINLSKLANLVATGESETIEFKEAFNDEPIETLVVFMNAKGGTLLI
ncbi:MAG: hypothetical protein QG673_1863 [Pseudomonadota bacterium]|nr:hypothetical protein [Pseudomonadota bacterium]